ncbi:antitoxin ParD1/3/4 [Sphingobium sp. AP50]|uniref:type II toxin-antitoxin system ParD family antitoxin n=1 Tax=Sphingobium sp. AP50 TaxID=1884369 RepID=UPI0008AD9C85|nr:type II toxin-antitoxin system ParD family antitoxin [Sphingobium sp. AP50]SEI56763.1 antitoxin ParD1/3/4 [Sphingobium sp. AP50]
MANLNISMPPALEQWVDIRLSQGRYADAADYLRDLVRRDQEQAEEDREWLKAMIAEGEASGILDDKPEDIIAQIIAEYPARDA